MTSEGRAKKVVDSLVEQGLDVTAKMHRLIEMSVQQVINEVDRASNREKAQAHFYQEFSRLLMQSYIQLYPDVKHYDEESALRQILAEIAHLRLVKLTAKAHIAEWSEGDTFAHDTRAALKAALED